MPIIATFDNQVDAHIALGRLEAEGLTPALRDEHLVQTDWLYGPAVGGIKLLVPTGEASRAREILAADYSEATEPTDTGTEEGEGLEEPEAGACTPATVDGAAALAHLSALAGVVIPLGHLLGPILVWAIQTDDNLLRADQAREAANFQLTVSLAGLILYGVLPEGTLLPALTALFLADLGLLLWAALRARYGEAYRYPVNLRLLR